MVELELLEGRQGAVALLDQPEVLALLFPGLDETVVADIRLAEKRASYKDDARYGEKGGEDERGDLHRL